VCYTAGAQCAGVSVERRWLYRATGADGLHRQGSVRWCVFGVSLALTSSGYQCVTPPGLSELACVWSAVGSDEPRVQMVYTARAQ
jgi:hypothetical protein